MKTAGKVKYYGLVGRGYAEGEVNVSEGGKKQVRCAKTINDVWHQPASMLYHHDVNVWEWALTGVELESLNFKKNSQFY